MLMLLKILNIFDTKHLDFLKFSLNVVSLHGISDDLPGFPGTIFPENLKYLQFLNPGKFIKFPGI